jgi:hypothetical protein
MEVQMKRLVAMLVLVAGVSVFATPVNITVTGTTPVSIDWFGLPGTTVVPPGDNQMMPGTDRSNAWDMEAVLLDGNNLSLVASYDWANGEPFGSTMVTTGDLFIAVNGSSTYNYALRFDYGTSNYDVYQLSSSSKFIVPDDFILGSAPFEVDASTATDIGTHGFQYQTGLSDDAALGYTSWGTSTTHNEITLDLANFLALQTGEEIATHITMSCGNDELNGFGRVPEPGSLSMILVGLLSLGGLALSRKRK